MSQSGLADLTREKEWDAWYNEHLRIMLTVPGVSSTQRFKTDTPAYSPSLAMYSFSSAAVFQDPYYLSVRGMGEWLPLISREHYHRNLFEGLDAAPEVGEDDILLVTDRETPETGTGGLRFTWLKAVAIDRSTPYRGIAVVGRRELTARALSAKVGIYRPVTPCNRKN